MPKQVKLADAKANLSAIVEEVERTGRVFEITKRGKPAALLTPVGKKDASGSAFGSLSQYADADARAREKDAWADAARRKADSR